MIYNLPVINSVKDVEALFSDMIIISHYDTYEKFDELYNKVYMATCACFELKECISWGIPFKFYDDNVEIHSLSLPKFLLNINAWRPLIELNRLTSTYGRRIEVLDESFIIGTIMSNSVRLGLESKVLKVLTEYAIPFETRSELLQITIERYQEISIEFALCDHSSVMTLENIFLNDYRNSEKIRELNNLEVNQNLQTSEVEDLLREKSAELFHEFGVLKNPIWYVMKAGNHIKMKQVQELYISYGQIPDVTSNVIPYTMTGNGFATGYVDPISYYIAATGARLSAIMNKTHMGEAGYLARNLILSSRTMTLSRTVHDCGTKHLLPLTVTDSTFLHRLENRWFSEYMGGDLEMIHYSTHKHLIGKRIWLRSLLTCNGGDDVCHVCYGGDSHLVMNMPGMAVFNTEVYSEPVSQNILSTKHLLFTAANKLTFNNAFGKYFKYNSGDVFVKEREEWTSDVAIGALTIRIEEDNVIPVNQQDIVDHNTFGNNIESPLYIYNSRTKEYDEIQIVNYESMFVDASSMKYFKLVQDKKTGKTYYEITLDSLTVDLDGRLMSIDIKNNGLTDNLYMIMNLLNKNAAKYEDNYSQLAQDFFDTLINAGINCRNIQGEIILNRLIRDASNQYKRPDFSKFVHPAVKILNLNQALLNTEAPTVGLSYQETKRQLLGDDLYLNKKGGSYLDPLYATNIPTESFRRKSAIIRENRQATRNKIKEVTGRR